MRPAGGGWLLWGLGLWSLKVYDADKNAQKLTQRCACKTCKDCRDIWDTDYNTDNWEPGFMTIFVTWHLIVTLDSIRNSCDVLEWDTETPVDTILKSYLLQPLETLIGAANFLTPSVKKVRYSKIWGWRHEHAIACNPSITSHIASRCLWWALLYLHHIPIISSFDKTQMRKQKVAPLLFCWCNNWKIKPKVIVHPNTNLALPFNFDWFRFEFVKVGLYFTVMHPVREAPCKKMSILSHS